MFPYRCLSDSPSFLSISLSQTLTSVSFMIPSHTHGEQCFQVHFVKILFITEHFFFLYLGVCSVFLSHASFFCLTWKAFQNLTLTTFSWLLTLSYNVQRHRQFHTGMEQMQSPMYFTFSLRFNFEYVFSMLEIKFYQVIQTYRKLTMKIFAAVLYMFTLSLYSLFLFSGV